MTLAFQLVALDVVFCRCVRDAFPPLSTRGSRLLGGRFNPPGLPALYLAETPELAVREGTQFEADAGFKPFAPHRLVCVEVSLQRVVDLSTESAVQTAGLSVEHLRRAWQLAAEPTPTQLLGRRAFDAGIEGLLFSSRLDPSARNLAVFPDNLLASSRVRVVEEEPLAE